MSEERTGWEDVVCSCKLCMDKRVADALASLIKQVAALEKPDSHMRRPSG